jgi:hypothetical protein
MDKLENEKTFFSGKIFPGLKTFLCKLSITFIFKRTTTTAYRNQLGDFAVITLCHYSGQQIDFLCVHTGYL